MNARRTFFMVLLIAVAWGVGPVVLAQEPGGEPAEPAAGGEEEAQPEKGDGEQPGEGDETAEAGDEAGEGEEADPEAGEVDLEEAMRKAREYAKQPDLRIEVVLKRGTLFEGVARRGILAETKKIVEVEGEQRREQIYEVVPWQKVLKEKKKAEKKAEKEGEEETEERGAMVPRTDEELEESAEGEALKDLQTAGIRIWYFRNTRGYIFISFDDVVELHIVRVLSFKDSVKLFQRIEEREQKLIEAEREAREAEQERERIHDEMLAEKREQDLAKKRGLDAEAAAKAKKRREELLKKFPPSEGWNKDRKKQIMVRMIQGVNPTPKEREFYKVFDEWLQAVEDSKYIEEGG